MKQVAVSEKISRHYEDYYEDGDSEWRRLGALGKVENIVALCEKLHPGSVLEIGAGEGSILKRLSQIGFGRELAALDISPSGVETIKRKNIERLTACQVFDGYHVPFVDKQFDLAILSHVVEHLEHPRELLYEAARVAKYLFVEVPLEDNIRLAEDFVFDDVGHINAYSPRTIRRLLQSCGMVVLGEVIQNPPRATYVYQKGRKGLINYYIKEALLTLAPRLATELFTYHAAYLCETSVVQDARTDST
jgi:ubiquinone/menaquinone biosynthesis C-methylase UbiE